MRNSTRPAADNALTPPRTAKSLPQTKGQALGSFRSVTLPIRLDPPRRHQEPQKQYFRYMQDFAFSRVTMEMAPGSSGLRILAGLGEFVRPGHAGVPSLTVLGPERVPLYVRTHTGKVITRLQPTSNRFCGWTDRGLVLANQQ